MLKNLWSVMVLGMILMNSAQADIIMNPGSNQNSRVRTEWERGAPHLVTGTLGCGSSNICIGNYVQKTVGIQGPAIVTGSGFAYCNAINGACPSAGDCINDNNMTVNFRPTMRAANGRVAPSQNGNSAIGN